VAYLIVALLSGVAGVAIARRVRTAMAIVLAGGAAWLGFLGWLLFCEYVLPYQGGGASMWPIALIFGGTFAAFVAGCAAGVTVALSPRNTPE
jgi:hypothetical protein